MEPRDLVRVSILASLGALALGIGAWMVSFGLGGSGAPSPLAPLVLLVGLAVVLGAVVLLGSAGADAVWARLRRRRERQR